jgi:hypothetical protein
MFYIFNSIVADLTKSSYGMHTPMELLINPPSKHMGKTMIKEAINEYWYKKYTEEKSTKTTIRHLEIQKEHTIFIQCYFYWFCLRQCIDSYR